MKTAVLVLAALMGLSVAGDHRQNSQDCYVKYPNIPGETLLENDRLVVQKFIVRPGQWEGIHTHPGNQLYVHIKGGKWAVRYGEKEDVSVSGDGSIGWYPKVELSQQHQSGNVGETTIELLWITLKPCGAAAAL
jgi:hypothetical protein